VYEERRSPDPRHYGMLHTSAALLTGKQHPLFPPITTEK